MKNEVSQIFVFCYACKSMLPVDVKFNGSIMVPINFKWARDGARVYCSKCAREIERFNENDESENEMYDYNDSQGGMKNRPEKENRILAALEEYGPLNVAELSRITTLPRSTTTQRLKTMLREKTVEVNKRRWKKK